MSLPKAQLVDPQGNMNLPGMTATGVVTATSLKGDIAGSATALTGNPDLDVGIVTASSFVGQGDGHAANITGTPQLNLGITTATSFVGDATGKAAGLTGTPNLNVGLITATSFVGFVTGNVTGNVSGNVEGNITGDITGDVTGNVTGNIAGDVEGDVVGNISGNVTGLASSIKSGASLGVGVCTAIAYYGDGSGLSGAGSSAYIAQEVTATSAETIIDLSYGNVIYYKGQADTTVGFASTSPAEQLTFIRDTSSTFDADYNESFSTGGVTFDGTGDYLSMADNAAFQLGTGDWTMECFWKSGSGNGGNYQQLFGTQAVFAPNDGIYRVGTRTTSNQIYFSRADGSGFEEPIWNINVNDEAWHHLAFTRASGYVYLWVDGVQQTNVGEDNYISGTMSTNNSFLIGHNARDDNYITGTVSNLRIVKGTAIYTAGANFLPPSAALTNVTNTVLLCCQSDSSTTASTVSAGTITANGDPAAGAQTVAYSGTNTVPNGTITWPDRVKWNNNTTPTLFTNVRPAASQIFRFTTVDTGLNYNAWEEIKNDSSLVEIWQWGLITGNNNPGAANKSSPTQLPGTNWKALNGPFDNNGGNMVWTKTDGTLWSWGYGGNYGAPGLNSTVQYSSPIQVGTDTNWKQASAGYRYDVAVKTDGTLWSWGYGERGVLGLNNSGHSGIGQWRSSPTQVPGTTWTRVHGMGNQTSAFKTDGTLWVWGLDSAGSFAQNNQTDRSSPTQVPGTWDPDGQFKTEKFAKKADGTWWGWGSNSFGQLGQNNRTQYSSPIQLPGTWAQIDASRNALGVKTDGTLWVWGSNAEGILGLNAPDNSSYSSPVQVGSGMDWSSNVGAVKSSAPTTGTSACIKTDGSLWMWGKNVRGSLGQNQAQPQVAALSSPTQVPGIYTEIQGVNQESYGVTSLRGV